MQEKQEFLGRYKKEELQGEYFCLGFRFKSLEGAIRFAKKQPSKNKLEAFSTISIPLAKKGDYGSALEVAKKEYINAHVDRKKVVDFIQKEFEKNGNKNEQDFKVVGTKTNDLSKKNISSWVKKLKGMENEQIFEYVESLRGSCLGEKTLSLVSVELAKNGKFELAIDLAKSIDYYFYSERAVGNIAIELAKKNEFKQAFKLIEEIRGFNYFNALYGVAIEQAKGDVDEALKMIRVLKTKKEAKIDDISLIKTNNAVLLSKIIWDKGPVGELVEGSIEDLVEDSAVFGVNDNNKEIELESNVLRFIKKEKPTFEHIKYILNHNFLFGRALAKLGICYSGRNIMINCPRVTLSNAENILMNAVTVLDTYDVNLPFEIMGKVREMSDEANDILLDYAVGVFGINYADRWHWIIENSLEVTLDNADNIIDAGEILTDEFLQKNGIRFSSHIKEKIKNMLYKANTIVLKDDESLVGGSKLLDQAMNTLGIDFDSENYFNLSEVTESNADNIRKAILVFEDWGYLEKNDILLPFFIVQKIERMLSEVEKMLLKKGLN